jgi:hypothetical protein
MDDTPSLGKSKSEALIEDLKPTSTTIYSPCIVRRSYSAPYGACSAFVEMLELRIAEQNRILVMRSASDTFRLWKGSDQLPPTDDTLTG